MLPQHIQEVLDGAEETNYGASHDTRYIIRALVACTKAICLTMLRCRQ